MTQDQKKSIFRVFHNKKLSPSAGTKSNNQME